MADQNTSIVNNDNLLMSYFEKRAIKTLHESVWFYQMGEKYPLPMCSGQSITFNGWRTLAAASSTLAEASANSTVSLSSRKVAATIASYGRGIKITDLLEKTSILPVEPGALKELEQSAALTVDNMVQLAVFKNVLTQVGQAADTKAKILSAYMSATASAFCANTGLVHSESNKQFGFPVVFGTSATRLSAVSATAPSISAKLGPIAVRKAVTRLKRLNVKPMADGYYVAIAHPNAMSVMMSNPDFKQWALNYESGPKETMYKHIVGKVHQVKFMESTNCPRFVGAGTGRPHSVNLTPIFGEGALGVTELDGGVKMILKRPGPNSTDNPYDLFSTLTFKVRGVAAVLNPSAGVIVLTSEKF